MPVNGQRSDLPLLPILEQRDQLVGGNRPFSGQQLRVRGQSRWCQSLTRRRAARFGEFAPLYRERRCCRLVFSQPGLLSMKLTPQC